MRITFLIGNGFDLNLGLKTDYKSFYDYYTALPTSKNDMLAKAIKKDYKFWSDLEKGLGEYTEHINEDQIGEFIDSKFRLEDALVEYLKTQEEKIKFLNDDRLAEELKSMLEGFSNEFNTVEKERYKSFISGYGNKINYSFVTFNYTDVLDNIIQRYQKNGKQLLKHVAGSTNYNDVVASPLHIHGTLESGLILGVDCEAQITNNLLSNNPELADYIVKAKLNKELGEKRMDNFSKIIDESQYICLFGLSVGLTDQTWWKNIVNWLFKDSNRRLVIYKKTGDFKDISAAQSLRRRNQNRIEFKKQSECSDEVYERINGRIIVINNSPIFKFESISLDDDKVETTDVEEAM